MDTTLIKLFLTVAQLQHMSNAALELNMSQSSLSTNISKLEAELGVKLFTRKGRNIQLNELGQQYYDEILPVIQQFDMVNSNIKKVSDNKSNRLTIVAPPMFTFSHFLTCLRSTCPDAIINYAKCTYSNLINQLLSGEIDLCIVARPLQHEQLKSAVIQNDSMAMLVSKTHPLASHTEANLSDFKKDDFVDYPDTSPISSNRDDLCKLAGFKPTVSFEVSTMRDIIEVVRSTHHVALLPQHVLALYDLTGCSIINLKDSYCSNCLTVYMAKNNTRKITIGAYNAVLTYFS